MQTRSLEKAFGVPIDFDKMKEFWMAIDKKYTMQWGSVPNGTCWTDQVIPIEVV